VVRCKYDGVFMIIAVLRVNMTDGSWLFFFIIWWMSRGAILDSIDYRLSNHRWKGSNDMIYAIRRTIGMSQEISMFVILAQRCIFNY
jgi:hypothetical protein